MILLDTDTVTSFAYGNLNVKYRIENVDENEELGITVITRYEILRGQAENLLKAANEQELQKASERFRQSEALISAFRVIDFDDDSISYFGRLRNARNLKKMGRADMLIASIALANQALLVTRNTKDFEKVPRLRIENWVD